ncbi:ArsC/Spx/MgsR family protein [Rhodocytophaga aerolata]|uniref:ArsC/Spx/MgsR family protein n=1 Tax=Rhodocytophaga aerolata TaxID=455078 RepID=A0ABT8R8M6_9BACT|nr:ArsC/Spx/MgsR family protein [Rhodocytophaga aerolata]MDO1447714.1 ArsC/Spx/MgsR family protein [Rhodocytophaga aerolata]
MDFNNQTVTIFYKGNKRSDEEALGYARPLKPHSLEIDLTKDNITSTQLMEIANKLGVSVGELVDRESDMYKEKYNGMDFDDNNWLTLLTQNPELLRTPIIFNGDQGIIAESGRDVIKFGTAQK